MIRDSVDHDVTDLVEHFERVLGPIHTGWSTDPDGNPMPFQVVRFSGGSDVDSVGYATLGLSRHRLTSPASGRSIRQELFMLAPDSMTPDWIVSLLLQVGSVAVRTQRALLRGNVIGPAEALVPDSGLTALYVTMPVYFPTNSRPSTTGRVTSSSHGSCRSLRGRRTSCRSEVGTRSKTNWSRRIRIWSTSHGLKCAFNRRGRGHHADQRRAQVGDGRLGEAAGAQQ